MTALERDGGVIIEGLLCPERLARFLAWLFPLLDAAPDCQGDFYGYATRRLSGLIARVSACRELAILPLILQLMDIMLLRGCREYQLNLTQAIRIGPGEPRQFLHSDALMFPVKVPGSETMINCMYALDDFTEGNGAAMKAGSALIYLGSVIHAGGANRTGQPRTGVALSYCLGWLRQAENHYLAVPRELPERLQRLLGYFVHEPDLGSVDGQGPVALLREPQAEPPRFTEFLPEDAKTLLAEARAAMRND
ncbi:phytanoyl-CoA dioxygenase family protein [Chromobacterium piscinae]|uniref:phytanoyl-CoA dioxygenase family protein n=1 Tax=Chromobacterium piscinae TaxID=686831 RepID=UPI001E32DCB7|nr:phytanoyl-CoA dioxygenase family protein [Chromobacterium piscinae]MCD4504623.1 phytanoyl-CoA dioxygenase family protein [Chromobacterium piscinae]